MKTIFSLLTVCGLLAMPVYAGTQTENYGIPVLPAPGKVVIDGRFDDWDLTGGIFACNNVEEQRDRHSGWLHAMYDQDNLYVPARVKTQKPVGGIWAINGNIGEWHVLTEDGFYLTRLFQGDGFKIQWPDQAVPGAILDNVPPGLGGEDFGGSLPQGADGKVYIQAGKTALWNVEVTGLAAVREIPGGQVTIGVVVLDAARIEVKVDAPSRRYVVEAAIPLSSLGLKLTDGLALRGDFGATHGDKSGKDTMLRSHWNNQSTGIVNDEVFELKMEPANWGEISFQP